MAWADLMSSVGMELLRGIAVALGLPEDHFDEPFGDEPAWMGKLVHYVGGVVEAAGDQGVGSHADYGFVTLLLQDEVGGLEVLPHGTTEWATVEPIPGAQWFSIGPGGSTFLKGGGCCGVTEPDLSAARDGYSTNLAHARPGREAARHTR
jgi:isopenicillin N synthase-like dioxygenase